MTNNANWSPLDASSKLYNNYLDFILTSFAPNNRELQILLKEGLSSEYLYRGPYISIPGKFKLGIPFSNFEKSRIKDEVKNAFPYISYLYLHQEEGITNILNGRNTIASISTGSGKTEFFLIPILNYCFEHKGERGLKAIIVYPMNALANDQVERLRKTLWILNKNLPNEEKIKFAIYNGDTPSNLRDMKEGEKSLDGLMENCFVDNQFHKIHESCVNCDKRSMTYNLDNQTIYCQKNSDASLNFQIFTRDNIQDKLPDILITNYVQLEHLLLRADDDVLFSSNSVKYLIFDEIHTYSGARGIDVALLIRRIRNRLKTNPICIGLSATLSTSEYTEGKMEIAQFSSKLFGVDFQDNDIIIGTYQKNIFTQPDNLEKFEEITEIEYANNLEMLDEQIIKAISRKISVKDVEPQKPYSLFIGKLLLKNQLFQCMVDNLELPTDFTSLKILIRENPNLSKFFKTMGDDVFDKLIWSYLKLASISSDPELSDKTLVPLINVNVHNFFKTLNKLYKCNNCSTIYNQPRDICDCGSSVDEIGVCRFCGRPYVVSLVYEDDFISWDKKIKDNKKLKRIPDSFSVDIPSLKKVEYQDEYLRNVLPIWQTSEKPNEDKDEIIPIKKCISCGSILNSNDNTCDICKSSNLKFYYAIVRKSLKSKKDDSDEELNILKDTQPVTCPFCGNSYGSRSALSSVSMSPNTASITIFDMVYSLLPEDYKKMLIFTDNRQACSYLAGYLEDGHLDHAIRNLIFIITKEKGRINLLDIIEESLNRISTWYGGNFEGFGIDRHILKQKILKEIASLTGAQRSVENLGLVEINYRFLENNEQFTSIWFKFASNKKLPQHDIDTWRRYLIALLNEIRTDGALKGLEKHLPGRERVIGYNLNNDNKKTNKFVIIKAILNKNSNSIRKLTERTFSTTEHDITNYILLSSFEFLTLTNLLILVTLEKWKEKSDGYVINDNYVIIKIPKTLYKCNKCQRIYSNPSSEKCSAYKCNGKLVTIKFDEHVEQNKNNHYINLYTSKTPLKMVTKEDTGALDIRERRQIESEFKKDVVEGRKVDVVIATPTLELGVDIGDLLSVGLFKAPPSPASYTQRIGRAGRKEKISFNNTFLFSTPIDKLYFNDPEKLIKGDIEPPLIDLENTHILQRHINSLILEELLVNSNEKYPYYMKDFTENSKNKILSEIDKINTELLTKVSLTLKDFKLKQLNDSQIKEMIEIFKISIGYSLERFNTELSNYKSYVGLILSNISNTQDKHKWDRLKNIYDQIDKLNKESFISYLMDMNVLPRYAFPGILVDIRDDWGYDKFGARARNYAITEYAPMMEVFLKKKVYKSIGVDLNILTPTRKTFYICPKCKNANENEEDIRSVCHVCGNKVKPLIIECIEPNIIYIKKTEKRINEPKNFQEAISNIFLQYKSKQEKLLDIEKNVLLTKYLDANIVQIVDKVIIENEEKEIEICDECGKVKESLKDEKEHWKIGVKTKNEKCKGKFKKLALYHKMPTNVISIKIQPNATTLFGIDVNNNVSDNIIFLTTLKNAIINAALYYAQAQDGEIDGDTNDQEIILYDNVDGGAGYVDRIYDTFPFILKKAAEIVLDCNCESGCLECIWSYRRKRDIPYIDKKRVEDLFNKIISLPIDIPIKPQTGIDNRHNIESVFSPSYSLKGFIKLRDLLRNAQEEILITSLYVTNDKLNWPDEIDKSWVDILSSIKLSSKENLKISVVIREPSSREHAYALKKLLENGIAVYVYKKELEYTLPSIVHSKLVVIDPSIPKKRQAIHMSANFSPEMWKNHDTIAFGNEESLVKSTYEEIRQLISQSHVLQLSELINLEKYESEFISTSDNPINLINKVLNEFSKAKHEICIMDPYLDIRLFEKLITENIHSDVKLKVITARVEDNKLSDFVNKLREHGKTIQVIRFLDKNRTFGKETIIHDRYAIFDGETAIYLGKGISTLFEHQTKKVMDNTKIEIISSDYDVSKYVKNFNFYFDHENSEKFVKDFYKNVY